MEADLVPLLLLLLLPILAIVSFLYVGRQRSAMGATLALPPSPWALPVLGHLHHLAGDLPHRAMRDLARRHGPLILLRLGRLPVVVVSSADAAREVMVSGDVDFATRPMTRTLRLAIPEGSAGIVFSPYGEKWRQMRKICTVELLSARCVQSFRSVREQEVGRLLRQVAAAPATVNLSDMLARYVADSSVRSIMGSSFKDTAAFLALMDIGAKLVAKLSLADLYPSSRLAMLLSRKPGQVKRQREKSEAFMDAIVREHQEKRAAAVTTSKDEDQEEDLLDALLRIQGEGDLTTENIKGIIGDMLGGATESTATTLQMIMAELIRNPRVMRKVQDEIRGALAGQPKVTEASLAGAGLKLNYMRMVIKEVLRLHPPTPLLLPRECRKDGCRVAGFDVPKGTMLLVNAWAISRDPARWHAADDFLPERFEPGGEAVDFKGADIEFTPFGAGRRMCPGMAFGLANLELALAGLLYHFDWNLPAGADIDMTEKMSIGVRLRQDLLLVPVVRVPVPQD